jgi:hypothetical protein
MRCSTRSARSTATSIAIRSPLDARHETGRLDGGSLRLGFAGSAPVVHFDNPLGGVNAPQSWLLEFTAIGIDNVRLRPVSAAQRSLADIARLETNPSSSKRSFVLDAQTYRTPDGVIYPPASRITLQPLRSIMLIRQE